MRDPGALVSALRRIEAHPAVVRADGLPTAHLWLEYPHTRISRWLMGSRRILPRRIARIAQLVPSTPGPSDGTMPA
jgi:hypothetical protein